MKDQILSEQNVLITGGTGRLGESFCRQAIEAGANLYFTYYQNETKAKELEGLGATGFKVNLASTPEMESFVKRVKEKTKTLDVLIHNAAAVRDHTLKNMTEEDWDAVMNVDLKAPYFLTKQLLRLLFKGNQKKIFFLTSRMAVKGGIGVSNYAAAKAGLIGLTKSLAQELGKKNVLVNAINPGFMKSQMTQELPEAAVQAALLASPLQRMSDPDEVAKWMVYLASPEMTQVTGQVLHLESRSI